MDNQKGTARKGQPERDHLNCASRTRHRTELPTQDCQDSTAKTGKAEQDSQDRTAGQDI
jgi:hypothetical protein